MRRRNIAISGLPKRSAPGSSLADLGPPVTFAATVLATFAALVAATALLPGGLVMPAISTLFYVFAALVALVAWLLRQSSEHGTVSYWDVAGALTLCGIFAGILIDPDQLLRLVTER